MRAGICQCVSYSVLLTARTVGSGHYSIAGWGRVALRCSLATPFARARALTRIIIAQKRQALNREAGEVREVREV